MISRRIRIFSDPGTSPSAATRAAAAPAPDGQSSVLPFAETSVLCHVQTFAGLEI
jgi:hypothetical protein